MGLCENEYSRLYRCKSGQTLKKEPVNQLTGS